ncbi:MAG: tyrosine recombinase XerD [Candidatus Xenolissoclinum pacificiensis L6]|uniref:Tyrosine recombinase XerD n=1 Tax=Candidatus Xenolissoclinum pacificiensis L6 TaxID=1401685 RepID=W2V110_9RICK|nr:MAG: tyrosine recombinase XerD [Candidatus Xenolissoclinum pacificiensis L6]
MKSRIKEFIDMMIVDKDICPNTVDGYINDLNKHDRFFHNRELDTIENIDLEEFIFHLNKQGYSKSTIMRVISSVRTYYKFLHDEEVINCNPALGISSVKNTVILPKYLTEEEIQQIFKVAQEDKSPSGVRNQAILEMIYSCGMRVSEVLSIRTLDIQRVFDEGFIVIRGKRSKERIAPLTERALQILKKYLNLGINTDWLFPKDKRGTGSKGALGHMTRQRLGHILKSLSMKAGIMPDKVSPHVLRHSFATHMLNRGVDIRYIQEFLGHVSIKTTQVYTHISKEEIKSMINQHHPINQGIIKIQE